MILIETASFSEFNVETISVRERSLLLSLTTAAMVTYLYVLFVSLTV